RRRAGPASFAPLVLFAASLVSFFLALLAKETALILPLIVVIYDYSTREGFRGLRVKRYIPYIVVGVLYLVLRGLALEGAPSRELYTVNPVMQVLNVFPVLILYFLKLIWPVKLSPFYVYELSYSFFEAKIYLSAVAIAVLAFILWKLRRAYPEVILYAAIIVVPLLPTFYLLFNDPGVDHFSLPSDRYLYLSSVGFAFLLSFIYMRLAERFDGRKIILWALVVLIFLYSVGTFSRTFAWRNDKSLWESAVRDYPGNYYAHYALSGVYMEDGRRDEALREALLVKELRPVYPAVNHRLGLLYFSLGDEVLAEVEFREVLKTNPENRDAHYNLGVIYLGQRQWKRAALELEASLKNAGDDHWKVRIINSLAIALAGGGEIDKGILHLNEALKLEPKNKETLESIRFLNTLQGEQ
ncbi:MAG: tetratricopeptide repeat protein, partial [Thermodesulfobacteriota bacterium]